MVIGHSPAPAEAFYRKALALEKGERLVHADTSVSDVFSTKAASYLK